MEALFPEGYTNMQFGQLVGCSHSMASRVVNGKRVPGIEAIEKISEVFGIPLQTLLDARRKGAEEFGKLMQKRVVRPADVSAKRAAKA